MAKFPVDAPKAKVIRALLHLGFRIIREREHISMLRINADGTETPLTLPNLEPSRDQRYGSFVPKPGSPGWNSWTRTNANDRSGTLPSWGRASPKRPRSGGGSWKKKARSH